MARRSAQPDLQSNAWRVEIRTNTGRWLALPEICASQEDAEDVRDCYEGYLRFPDRRYTALRIVPPPGVSRRRRQRPVSARDATLARLAAERSAALERIATLCGRDVAVPAACGHSQPPPTPEEIVACPDILLRSCGTCGQLLHWHADEWHKLKRSE